MDSCPRAPFVLTTLLGGSLRMTPPSYGPDHSDVCETEKNRTVQKEPCAGALESHAECNSRFATVTNSTVRTNNLETQSLTRTKQRRIAARELKVRLKKNYNKSQH